MSRKEEIALNLHEIQNEIQTYPCQLIAVSKTKPAEDILWAYEAGQKVFGENKVQELAEKSETLKDRAKDIEWHFIGHLQSNKINALLAISHLTSIHSIDSIKLLNKLLSKSPAKSIGIFLQVNTSDEDEKSGFENIDEILKSIEMLKNHSDFYFQGLMTIGKIRTTDFEKDASQCFQKLVKTKADISQKNPELDVQLSMGMSNDYAIALKFGSNWIRVGSKIFGSR